MHMIEPSEITLLKDKWVERLNRIGSFWEYQDGPLVAELTLSGRVSDFYFNSNVLLSDPRLTRALCRDIFVRQFELLRLAPSFVMTVAPFGLPLASVMAEELGIPFGYHHPSTPSMLSRMPQDKDVSVIVTDDIWSGGSVRDLIELVRGNGLPDPVIILAIGNMSQRSELCGTPIFSVFDRHVNTWAFEDSPFASIPGVMPIVAREHWTTLVPRAFIGGTQ
jgi:orotate phosphoribosyltransferase